MIELMLVLQLIILLNPLSSFPLLLKAYQEKLNVRRIAVQAILLAFVIAVLIVICGPLLFSVFGVSIDSFRIAGGVVLFLLGIDTVRPREENHTHKKGVDEVDGLISIIATPLLTGPATISFVAIKTAEIGTLPMLANLVPAFIITGAVFIGGSLVVHRINHKIVSILSRVLGLFLTGMAIEMISLGMRGLFYA
ncbi:MAG: MarC family protein [Candidatus Micrarchaeota archaeon]|nr:MarC family protein [Candidatus Micrarchaeota archaeon]